MLPASDAASSAVTSRWMWNYKGRRRGGSGSARLTDFFWLFASERFKERERHLRWQESGSSAALAPRAEIGQICYRIISPAQRGSSFRREQSEFGKAHFSFFLAKAVSTFVVSSSAASVSKQESPRESGGSSIKLIQSDN